MTTTMTTINAFSATSEALDPSKHVNYLLGMVLGVKDFTQEFAYLSGRDRWMARDLIGYGTCSGLAAAVEKDGTNGPRVRIKPERSLRPDLMWSGLKGIHWASRPTSGSRRNWRRAAATTPRPTGR
jgi:hypothetical protein